MTPAQEARLEQVRRVKPKYSGIFLRVYTGKGSRSAAVKAFCLDCMGLAATEIPACTATACPLWGFRPYQKAKTVEPGLKAAGEKAA